MQGAFQEGQYWDTRTADHHSYHIVRRVKGTPQGDVLLVRGMQHPCGEVCPPQPVAPAPAERQARGWRRCVQHCSACRFSL